LVALIFGELFVITYLVGKLGESWLTSFLQSCVHGLSAQYLFDVVALFHIQLAALDVIL